MLPLSAIHLLKFNQKCDSAWDWGLFPLQLAWGSALHNFEPFGEVLYDQRYQMYLQFFFWGKKLLILLETDFLEIAISLECFAAIVATTLMVNSAQTVECILKNEKGEIRYRKYTWNKHTIYTWWIQGRPSCIIICKSIL